MGWRVSSYVLATAPRRRMIPPAWTFGERFLRVPRTSLNRAGFLTGIRLFLLGEITEDIVFQDLTDLGVFDLANPFSQFLQVLNPGNLSDSIPVIFWIDRSETGDGLGNFHSFFDVLLDRFLGAVLLVLLESLQILPRYADGLLVSENIVQINLNAETASRNILEMGNQILAVVSPLAGEILDRGNLILLPDSVSQNDLGLFCKDWFK